MSRVKEIERNILRLKSELTSRASPYRTPRMFEAGESAEIRNRLEELEFERKFILDRRESWLPRTIRNLLVPIIILIITTFFTLWLEKL